MATLREILDRKGSQVHAVSPAATVLEAIYLMNEHGIGALVVLDEGRVAGMFTERDVLRRVVADQRPPAQLAVHEVMTQPVICCTPWTAVEEAVRIVKERRVRHLPVVDDAGRLEGLVSIGDLNAYHASSQEAALQSLQEYVYSGL